MQRAGRWLGLESEFARWADEHGIDKAGEVLMRAMKLDKWLAAHHDTCLMELTEAEMQTVFETAPARLAPVQIRQAVVVFRAFLTAHGWVRQPANADSRAWEPNGQASLMQQLAANLYG